MLLFYQLFCLSFQLVVYLAQVGYYIFIISWDKIFQRNVVKAISDKVGLTVGEVDDYVKGIAGIYKLNKIRFNF